MRNAILIPASLLFVAANGCYVEALPPHHHDEVIVSPAPGVAEEDLNYGPIPEPKVEVVPPRPFFQAVWVPGHWVREHHRHEWVWVGGYWK